MRAIARARWWRRCGEGWFIFEGLAHNDRAHGTPSTVPFPYGAVAHGCALGGAGIEQLCRAAKPGMELRMSGARAAAPEVYPVVTDKAEAQPSDDAAYEE